MRPELPVSGPGRGGRVGASATQHVVQNLVRDTMRDEDVSALFLFFSFLFVFCFYWRFADVVFGFVAERSVATDWPEG